MTSKRFLTSAGATKSLIGNRQGRLATPLNAKRADRLVAALRDSLNERAAEDSGTSTPRTWGYGLAKVAGQRTYREIRSGNGKLHVVDVLTADEIDGVLAYTVDDAVVYPGAFPGQQKNDGSGVITSGRFKNNDNRVLLKKGEAGQTALQRLVDRTSVDSTFVGTGLSYIYSEWNFSTGRFDGDPEVGAICRLRRALDPRTGTYGWTFNPYVQIYDFLTKDRFIGGAGLETSKIDPTEFINGANWSDQLIDVDPVTRVALLTQDTNKVIANTLFEFQQSVSPFNYGDVVNLVAADSSQALPANLSPGVDYHVVPVRHRLGDFQIPAIALAATLEDALLGNVLAQGARLKPVNVVKVKEVRHMSGFTYTSTQSPISVLRSMLDSCGASIFLHDGQICITRDVFPSTVETVEEDDLFGDVAMTNRLPFSDRATDFTGSYNSLLNLFITKDYPTVNGGGIYKTLDRGRDLPARLDLPYIGKAGVAQREASRRLRRLRQERTITFSSDLRMFKLKPGTVFSMTKPSLSLDENTTFEVRDQTLFIEIINGDPRIGIDVIGRQLEAATFDLLATDEQVVAEAQIPGVDTVFDVGTPGIPTITESLFVTTIAGGVRARATVTWAASTGGFIAGYIVSYKQEADTVYTFVAQTPDTTVKINDIEPGTYEFRVQAVNNAQLKSEFAIKSDVAILALSAPPDDPTGFNGQINAQSVVLQWDRSSDLDVKFGGTAEVRHQLDTAGGEGGSSRFIASVDGNLALAQVPLILGTYYLRFLDQDGNSSGFAEWSTQDVRAVPFGQTISVGAFVSNDGVTENEVTIQEDPSFPSTNVDNTLEEDAINQWLTLPLIGGIDDVADIDDVDDIDAIQSADSVTPSGVYFFDTDVELSATQRVIVEAVIETEVVDVSSGIDSIANIDNVADIDGVGSGTAQIGQANAWVEARVSRGTIASDTFGPWQRVETAIFNHRSFQYRLQAESLVESVNIRVKQLRIIMREIPFDA